MKKSAGILLYKFVDDGLRVLLVHPGGPFFKNKDDGAWSIPKGEFEEGEDAKDAARREFEEETGNTLTGAEWIELLPVKQKGGKVVLAWAVKGDMDVTTLRSNTFPLEWPPQSGRIQQFEEVDRGEWFTVDEAKIKMKDSQFPLVLDLIEKLGLQY